MINFNKPHMVPQTTKSLAQGAEGQRHRQAKAYDADRANNHRQMDDIRHAQYRKQNTAVNKQKSHMQDNAAKASKRITGSSAYYKEQMTFEEFLALQEAEKRLVSPKRRNPQGSGTLAKAGPRRTKTAVKRKLDPDRGRYSQEGGPTEKAGQTDETRVKGGTREAGPNSGNRVPAHRSIVKYTPPKKEEPKTASKQTQEVKAEKKENKVERKEKKANKKATKDLQRAEQRREKETRDRKYKSPGFKGSFGREFGTDLVSGDKDVRRKARGRLGTAAAKGIKSVPGKAFNLVKGAVRGSQVTPPSGAGGGPGPARGRMVAD